ncbi:MAG: PepSY-associated TM helix domain-containing protein, partial [Gammaproteobacteria bacterium]
MTLRTIWVLAHRYAGLAMAAFLILVGLTGSLLAFLPEINHALTPHLFPPRRPTQSMGLGDLALKAQALLPQAEVRTVVVNESGSADIGFEPFEDPATGQPRELGFNQLVLDAATGKELGRLTVGGLPTGRDDLMAFIYRLHMNLALPTIGYWILGIVALVWTVDCFVGFYLTLPARRRYYPHPNPCMFAFMSIYHLVVGLWVCGHQGRCPHIHNRVLDRCGSSSEP